MEAAPGIHRIESVLGPRPFSQYLLHGDRTLLVDTGINATPNEVIIPWFDREKLDIADLDFVLNSHADVDHCGGNAAIRAVAPHAVFMAGLQDIPWITNGKKILAERYGWYAEHGPTVDYDVETKAFLPSALGPDSPVEVGLIGEEQICLGPDLTVEVLSLPGHSMGHVGLWEPSSKTAIVIDSVLGAGLLNQDGEIIHPPPYFDAGAYEWTIRRLQLLRPKMLLTAHFHPFRGQDVDDFLNESLDFIDQVRDAVTNYLEGKGEVTLGQALIDLNPELGPFTSFVNELCGPIRVHLNELVEARQAVVVEGAKPPRWKWSA